MKSWRILLKKDMCFKSCLDLQIIVSVTLCLCLTTLKKICFCFFYLKRCKLSGYYDLYRLLSNRLILSLFKVRIEKVVSDVELQCFLFGNEMHLWENLRRLLIFEGIKQNLPESTCLFNLSCFMNILSQSVVFEFISLHKTP